MKCPMCGSEKSGVSRSISKEDSIVRRRVCESCGHRWNTVEADLDQWDSMASSVKAMKFKNKALEERVKDLMEGKE